MAKSILTSEQRLLLKSLGNQKELRRKFYLTGGTALAEFYLKHRYSEDLDFFSEQEFEPGQIQVYLKKIAPEIGFKKIDFQKSFNRTLFFLHFGKTVVKCEFTYFPFTQLEKPQVVNSLKIDSLIDIAVNKTFTIYQNPRSRDFVDIYFIIKKKKWKLFDLMKQSRIKFDTHIDPIQMAQQLLQVKSLVDYPKMIAKTAPQTWQSYIIDQAKNLKHLALE